MDCGTRLIATHHSYRHNIAGCENFLSPYENLSNEGRIVIVIYIYIGRSRIIPLVGGIDTPWYVLKIGRKK